MSALAVNGDAQTNGVSHASPPSQPASAPSQPSQPSQPAAAATAAPVPPAPQASASQTNVPLTSLQDSGLSKRPRDARLIHMLLNSLGCTAYQERVPLQLLDFAYRHSSSILSDALHLSSDAYISQQMRAKDAPPGGGFKEADSQVSAQAVNLAINSRLQYQFGGGNGGGGLAKEFLLEIAQARNKMALPRVLHNEWGVRLPSEKFVLTGVPWGLKGDWIAQEEEDSVDISMEGADMEKGVEDMEEGGTVEDLFGADEADVNMDDVDNME